MNVNKSSWLLLAVGCCVGAGLAWWFTRPPRPSTPAVQTAATNAIPSSEARGTSATNPAVSSASVKQGAAYRPASSSQAASNVIPTRGVTIESTAGATDTTPPYQKVFVLSIGIDAYRDKDRGGFGRLANAVKDARELSEVLRTNFNRFEVTHLFDAAATKPAINQMLDAFKNRLTTNDDLIVFFSGHGCTKNDPEDKYGRTGFLIPYDPDLKLDASFKELQARAIDMKQLGKRLVGLRARHRLLLLDCCFSGFAGVTAARTNKATGDFYKNILHEPTVQVITTGTDQEVAPDSGFFDDDKQPIENGLFTYALKKVLGNPQIRTVDEVYFPLRAEVRNRAQSRGMALNPTHRYLVASAGDFVFIPKMAESIWASTRTPTAAIATRGYYEPVTETELADVRLKADRGNEADQTELKEKVDRYETRASLGDANAMAALVHLYGQGVGTRRDNQMAYRWAREGYDTSLPGGRYALATAYRKGYGVKQDDDAAKFLESVAGMEAFLKNLQNFRGLPGFASSQGSAPGGGGNAAQAALAFYELSKAFGGKPGDPNSFVGRVEDKLKARKWQDEVPRVLADWEGELSKVPDKDLRDFVATEIATMRLKASRLSKEGVRISLKKISDKLSEMPSNAPKSQP